MIYKNNSFASYKDARHDDGQGQPVPKAVLVRVGNNGTAFDAPELDLVPVIRHQDGGHPEDVAHGMQFLGGKVVGIWNAQSILRSS